MQLYAQDPAIRTRQLAADLGLLAWTVLWVLVARVVHGAVLLLAAPGKAVSDLGRSMTGNMSSAASAARDVPLVGDQLSGPFRSLAATGNSVRGAGQSAQDAVGTLATVLAVVLVVLPVGWLLLRWLPWRLGWIREATAARRLLSGNADLELLAARAMATAPLPRLAALPAGTGAAWRSGEPAAVRSLAALELGRLGLRLPDGTDDDPRTTGRPSSSPPR
jgi:hypothetical protein